VCSFQGAAAIVVGTAAPGTPVITADYIGNDLENSLQTLTHMAMATPLARSSQSAVPMLHAVSPT
jgi:hypothetical protein